MHVYGFVYVLSVIFVIIAVLGAAVLLVSI